MNRKLYIALVASLSFFAACTERPVDPVPSGPEASHSYIFFEPEVIESVESRTALVVGTSLPQAEGSAFGVLGFAGSNKTSIFGGGAAEVYWHTTDDVFKYDDLAIWHGNETVHRFYAYYPYDLNTGSSIVPNDGNPYISYTQPETEAGMQDILTAYVSRTSKDGPAVPLGFHHRLWALDVKIENGQTVGVGSDNATTQSPTIEITGIDLTVSDFPAQAHIYLDKDNGGLELVRDNNKAVILMTDDVVYSLPMPEDGNVIAKGADKTYGSFLFLPLPKKDFKSTLTIRYLDSTGKPATFTTSTAESSTGDFLAGKRYTITVKKTNDQFVVGTYFDPDGEGTAYQPGYWSKVDVTHTFN